MGLDHEEINMVAMIVRLYPRNKPYDSYYYSILPPSFLLTCTIPSCLMSLTKNLRLLKISMRYIWRRNLIISII